VREGRPFTEIITADYVMMSPYTARGYGMFEEVKARFKDADDDVVLQEAALDHDAGAAAQRHAAAKARRLVAEHGHGLDEHRPVAIGIHGAAIVRAVAHSRARHRCRRRCR
jgi:hypothetical protein